MNRGEAIVLLGFMGTGKSTVGRLLSERTGRPLYDTDEMVAERFKVSINEIFSQRGEAVFRAAEARALTEVPRVPAIVATGGGMILQFENVERMRELGTTVLLLVDEETLLQRLSIQATRPLLQTERPRETLRDLLRIREPLYRAAADITIDATILTPEEVTDAILAQVDCFTPIPS